MSRYRKVLTLWRAPLLLDDLAPNERASLLGASAERQQDVGLCRQRSCVKAERGSPPPCSLCEHLVTGPAFLEAWKTEYAQRARELQELEAEPTAGMLLAQMQAQFERFAANFAFVFERSRP
jgi:hypothetical protein